MGNIAMQDAPRDQAQGQAQGQAQAQGRGPATRAAAQSTFESIKPALVRSYPGRFAVVCGPRLLGVYDSVDDAFLASSRAFDGGALPEGAPLLITELAERQAVQVMARPYVRPAAVARPVPVPPLLGKLAKL
ncbi:MAG: hypothetical protein ABJA82_08075 [Myxococcales bacterium]